MPDSEYGSVQWHLKRLVSQLAKRSKEIKKFDDYYNGKHRLAFAGDKFAARFGDAFRHFADNWCDVIVDAIAERTNIQGFRFGDTPDADADAWRIFQANGLDADSRLEHTDMLSMGYGYGLVWADTDGEPLITVESPLEAIVSHAAGSRRKRSAGLKLWRGDDGYLYACLYLPDELYKFRSQSKNTELSAEIDDLGVVWQPYHPKTDDTWPLQNPLGAVPLVPLYNKPRTSRAGIGVSEIASIIPMQDAINKLCADLLVASEFGSFRQRYAVGLELDRDDEGNAVPPFRNAPGELWVAEASDGGDGPGASGDKVTFGEFGETNLSNIAEAISLFVQHIASQKRLPPHYLNANADRLSGESIKAAETGLVATVKRVQRQVDDPWEEKMRLAFAVLGDQRATEQQAEVIWADPESRTESEHIDALVKKQTLNVPDQQLWEDAGYSPQTIARFEAMRATDALYAALNPPAPVAPEQRPPRPPV